MEPLTAIIIDDESPARRLLRVLLEENCPYLEIAGEAENLPDGTVLIRKLRPDIVFLDIEMPGFSGTRLLEFLAPHETDFELIFTTAYSEFALKAFQMNAIDYLLKPLQEEQVVQAVAKAEQNRGRNRIALRLEELQNTMEGRLPRKLALPMADGILYVNLGDIVLMHADRMYTRVSTVHEGEILVSKPLRHFLDLLLGIDRFYQSHRSYLVNLDHVRRYSSQSGGFILMDNGESASISREKRDEFLRLLSL